MLKNVTLTFALATVTFFTIGQTKVPSKVRDYLEEATDHFLNEEYQDAVNTYQNIDTSMINSSQDFYMYGVSLLYSNHSERALEYLLKAQRNGYSPKEKPYLIYDDHHAKWESTDIDFNLGRAYHLHLKFDLAVKHYTDFKLKFIDAYHAKVKNHTEEMEAVDHFIKQAKSGAELYKTPIKNVVIENLGANVNSEHEEIVPLISADEKTLIFTSRRPGTTGGQTDSQDGKYMEDVYMTKKQDGLWRKPWKISKKINTDGHDACIGLSPNGTKLLLYKSNNHFTGDIYMSTQKRNIWSEPVKLPDGINTKHTENSASLSADERIIIFTSNRPEGSHGNEDLYMATRTQDGEWSEPKNLGSNINTKYDEDAPFIHPDGKTLYFSSKGHNSMGGFDIFVSKFDPKTETFSKPKNMGHPINTPGDDIFFVWSPDGKRAYFSSHHNDSYGDQDIYMMTYPDASMSVILVKGIVKAKHNGQPLEAKIVTTDIKTRDIVHEQLATEDGGEFVMILEPGKSYGISFEKNGYLNYTEHIEFPDLGKYYEEELVVEMELLKDGSITVLNNVFFENNKAELFDESHAELDKFIEQLKLTPELDAEIAGHTERGSTEDWNLTLSQMRAQAVVDYMISKGINKRRVEAVGYGAKYPRSTGTTDKEKEKNRRTEIILHNREQEGKNWTHFYDK